MPPTASISSLIPGIDAILAPSRDALRRAPVWVSEWRVASITTFWRRIRSPTDAGGSLPCLCLRGIIIIRIRSVTSEAASYRERPTSEVVGSVTTTRARVVVPASRPNHGACCGEHRLLALGVVTD
ncbi:MAG: hypothetical protein Ct9H300mP30_0700 [Methanobacteriota archaeon]|nr:MAG: hypothetical protein Ct9H300mP30_0700 [Euryarchaeota archaeon]